MTLLEMRDAIKAELDSDLLALLGDATAQDAAINRWINAGRRRLNFYEPSEGALTWNAGDTEVALPADYRSGSEIIPADGAYLDPYFLHGSTLRFRDPDGATTDGTATLFYRANPAVLDSDEDASGLPLEADDAAIAYSLYRFFIRIVRSRALYTRYSTSAGANAVDVAELEAIAQDHLSEFEAARDALPGPESATFFGD